MNNMVLGRHGLHASMMEGPIVLPVESNDVRQVIPCGNAVAVLQLACICDIVHVLKGRKMVEQRNCMG